MLHRLTGDTPGAVPPTHQTLPLPECSGKCRVYNMNIHTDTHPPPPPPRFPPPPSHHLPQSTPHTLTGLPTLTPTLHLLSASLYPPPDSSTGITGSNSKGPPPHTIKTAFTQLSPITFPNTSSHAGGSNTTPTVTGSSSVATDSTTAHPDSVSISLSDSDLWWSGEVRPDYERPSV